MGVVLPCFLPCAWTETQVSTQEPDGRYYIIQRDDTLTFDFSWENGGFPFVPCPDPQAFIYYYRKKNSGAETWSAWTILRKNTIPPICGPVGQKVVRTSGDNKQTASSGVTYTREIWFCEKGIYEVLVDSDCTVGGKDKWKARPIRVHVT